MSAKTVRVIVHKLPMLSPDNEVFEVATYDDEGKGNKHYVQNTLKHYPRSSPLPDSFCVTIQRF